MARTIRCKINNSAYKKLKNLKRLTGHPTFGDLIAYLVKQENKRRDAEDRHSRTHTGGRSLPPVHSSANENTKKSHVEKGTDYGKEAKEKNKKSKQG